MNAKVDVQDNKFDIFKWGLGAIVFFVALGLNYYFATIPLSLRVIGWIIIFAALLGIMATTQKGHYFIEFAREARVELRKVVWPTRQETIQTAAVIVGLVLFVGLILWGVDSVLLWAVGWLTGQRG